MNRFTWLSLFFLSIGTVMQGQTAGQLREQFFMDLITKPGELKASIKGFGKLAGVPEKKALYEVYKATKELVALSDSMEALSNLPPLSENASQAEALQRMSTPGLLETQLDLKIMMVYRQRQPASYAMISILTQLREKHLKEFSKAELKRIDASIYVHNSRIKKIRDAKTTITGFYTPEQGVALEFSGGMAWSQLYYWIAAEHFFPERLNYIYKAREEKVVVPPASAIVQTLDYAQIDLEKELSFEGPTQYGALLFLPKDPTATFIHIEGGNHLNRAYFSDYFSQYGDFMSTADLSQDQSFIRYWGPIHQFTQAAKRIYLKAGGVYKKVALESLIKPNGRFFFEDQQLIRLNDEKGLSQLPAHSSKPSLSEKSFRLIGNPDFDYIEGLNQTNKTQETDYQKAEQKTLYNWAKSGKYTAPTVNFYEEEGTGNLEQLTGSEIEIKVLTNLFKEAGWQGEQFLGPDASEQNVKASKSPGILHLATHSGPYEGQKSQSRREVFRTGRALYLAGGEFMADKDAYAKKATADYFEAYKAYEQCHYQLGGSPQALKKIAKKELELSKEDFSEWQKEQDAKRKAICDRMEDRVDELSETMNYIQMLKSNADFEKDGAITLGEIQELDLEGTGLVVLSACVTGLDYSLYEPDSFGLLEAFQLAGAESILGSFWAIDDKAASLLMVKMYAYLLAGDSKATALQKAKNDVRKLPGFSHPYFWGGWVLFGKQ